MAMLRLHVASDGSEVEVLEYPITRRQADSLRDALQELLYCEATE
jgi:transcriptional regulator of met regulon